MARYYVSILHKYDGNITARDIGFVAVGMYQFFISTMATEIDELKTKITELGINSS